MSTIINIAKVTYNCNLKKEFKGNKTFIIKPKEKILVNDTLINEKEIASLISKGKLKVIPRKTNIEFKKRRK
jgi:hypothetical protein